MYPRIAKQINKETNDVKWMSIISYLKVHTQHENTNNIHSINKTRYNRSPESKFMAKLSRSAILNNSNTVVSSKKHTGTNYFIA